MNRLLIILSLLLFTNVSFAKQYIDLNQLRTWSIIIPDDAIPSETYAAKEFQSLIEKAVGFKMKVSTKPYQPTNNVFIGYSSYMQNSSAGFSVDELGEEGLRIHIQPGNIAIAGGRPRGTLYGVYEFMERYLNIRFLTYDHTYIPQKSTWRIPCEEWTYIPSFTFRWSYYNENATHPDFAARLRVNTTTNDEKLGGVTHQNLISHTLYSLLPVEKYGKDHPEYFALVDGERKLEMWGGGPEPCVTNPDVIEIVAQNVIEALDKNPELKNFSVSQNDNDKYCHCERCEEINQREGTPMGSHLAFVNAVAERVEQKYPDVKIGTLAYWYTRKPPKTTKPRHNVQIELCSIECSTLSPLDDLQCEKNREFCRDMDIWGSMCDDIWIWNYNTNFSYYDLPCPNLRVISPNIQYFLRNHAKGIFMQANGNGASGEMCDLRNYVISRCLWNPQLDSWELAKEFCQLHYGKAGKTIFQYLDYLHDNAERSGYEPNCFQRPFEVGLNAKSSDKIYRFFQKALTQAKNETVRDRVEKASICSYRALLETAGTYEIQNNILRVVYPEQYGGLVQTYMELTEKHGLTRAEEWQPISHYYDLLKKVTQDGYPVEVAENDVWRVIIVPEQNGKIVELLHKPTNHHLLMPPEYNTTRHLFERMNLQEIGEAGYNHDKPAAFETAQDGGILVLTKTLEDGSVMERRIEPTAQEIRFQTKITHIGNDAKEYQIRVHPEFYTETYTNNSNKVSMYIKQNGWTKFNQDWKDGDGPKRDLLKDLHGGALAIHNHEKRYAIVETFDPAKIDRITMNWNTNYPIASPDLYTKAIILKPGESFTFQYAIDCVKKLPK